MDDWRNEGNCIKLTPEQSDKIFFIGRGGSPNRARLFCMSCPVLTACRDYAILYDEYGIWGGMTRDDRQALNWLQPILEQRAREAGQYEVRESPIVQFEAS